VPRIAATPGQVHPEDIRPVGGRRQVDEHDLREAALADLLRGELAHVIGGAAGLSALTDQRPASSVRGHPQASGPRGLQPRADSPTGSKVRRFASAARR
jgi:hypothetical protein